MVPALRELVLEGNLAEVERFRMERIDLKGGRLKLIRLGQSAGLYQYEVIWVGHKRGQVE